MTPRSFLSVMLHLLKQALINSLIPLNPVPSMLCIAFNELYLSFEGNRKIHNKLNTLTHFYHFTAFWKCLNPNWELPLSMSLELAPIKQQTSMYSKIYPACQRIYASLDQNCFRYTHIFVASHLGNGLVIRPTFRTCGDNTAAKYRELSVWISRVKINRGGILTSVGS